MKKILSIIFFLSLLLTGCDDYLNVLPSSEKEQDEMLSTRDGYRAVLTGAYIRMKQTSLYGQEMTFGIVENLAQHWDYASALSVNTLTATTIKRSRWKRPLQASTTISIRSLQMSTGC